MRDFVKRLVDLSGATVVLAATSPFLLAAAAAVRVSMGSPVLFRQQRPGLHGKPFELVKFRTMRAPKAGEDAIRTDADRLSLVGRILRSTSVDELPTLWNVVRGDMSLVGPRPLLMQYLQRYTPEQARRHDVKPGITGWAQVNGRQTILFSKRLEYDLYYVDHQSLLLDLKILAMTATRVLIHQGVIPGQSVDDVDDLGLSR